MAIKSTTGGALHSVGTGVISTPKTDKALADIKNAQKEKAKLDLDQLKFDRANSEKMKMLATQKLANRVTGGDDRDKEYIDNLYKGTHDYYTEILAKDGGPTHEDVIELDSRIKDNNAIVTFSKEAGNKVNELIQSYDPTKHSAESIENIDKWLELDPEEKVKQYADLVQLDILPDLIDPDAFMKKNKNNIFVKTGNNNQYLDVESLQKEVNQVSKNILNTYDTDEWDQTAATNPLYKIYEDIKNDKEFIITDKNGTRTVKAQAYLSAINDTDAITSVDPGDEWFLTRPQKVANGVVTNPVTERQYAEFKLLRSHIDELYRRHNKPDKRIRSNSSTTQTSDLSTGDAGFASIGYRNNDSVGKITQNLPYEAAVSFDNKHGAGGSIATMTVSSGYYNAKSQKMVYEQAELTPQSQITVYTNMPVAKKEIKLEDGTVIKKGTPVSQAIMEEIAERSNNEGYVDGFVHKRDVATFTIKNRRGGTELVYVDAAQIAAGLNKASDGSYKQRVNY